MNYYYDDQLVQFGRAKSFQGQGPFNFKTRESQDAWVVQLIKCPTLDLGSALGLRVMSLSLMWVSTLGMQPI